MTAKLDPYEYAGHYFDTWAPSSPRTNGASILCTRCGMVVHQQDGDASAAGFDSLHENELRTRRYLRESTKVDDFPQCPNAPKK